MAKTSSNRGAQEAIALVVDTAGKLFGQWGYREILGRVWSRLYLQPEPVDAESLRDDLSISSGSLSMALKDLVALGLVYRETGKGGRRFFYWAETDIWRVSTRLFREHERNRLESHLARVQKAEQLLQAHAQKSKNDTVIQFQLEQVHHLVRVGEFIIDLLDAFVDRTKVELKAARKWLSVSGKLGGEPFSRLRRAINASRDDRKRLK